MTRSSNTRQKRRQRRRRSRGCLPRLGLLAALVLVVLIAAKVTLETHDPVNILVMGLDRRPQEVGPSRSDVLMVVNLDPRRDSVSLLSVPRDLYVWIPGHGEGRINAAYFLGEWEAPGGGPGLTAQTVTQNFGLPIEGYIKLDFWGFVQVVDALGGVYVEVPEEIRDTRYPTDDYGYTNIAIPAGRQKMDGETALIYVRTRYGYSDFDRTRRQQQVLTALLRRAASPAGWVRLPAVLNAVRTSVNTDLGLGWMVLWAVFALRSDLDSLDRIVIGETMTFPRVTEGGSQVLMPDWNQILPLMRRFGGG